jgi:glycosyltransferase involved in cell wall biosynthesis
MSSQASKHTLPERERRRLLIAGEFGFPNGTGATARIHAYAKGLRAAGCDVEVVPLRWSERDSAAAMNRQAHGWHQGTRFTYVSGSPDRAATFVRRRARDARSAVLFGRLIRGTIGQPPANVLLFSQSALWIVLTTALCRLAGTACVLEKSEYPFIYARDSLLMRMWAHMFTRTIYRIVDGAVVISTCLEDYFRTHLRRGARVIRVPILVDLDEFAPAPTDDSQDGDTLCYVGNLDHQGEVDGLLDAFGRVSAQFPRWSLRIVGGSSDPQALARLKARAAYLGLVDRVEFVGSVDRSALPALFREAGAFVLPRASGLFSTAGFPTKLGEYLASARPVVVTATGDIPLFLSDGVDAYLVAPDDTQAFAARLTDMLADPLMAREIGARGRETARREFDLVAQCRRLAAFMADFDAPDAACPLTTEAT